MSVSTWLRRRRPVPQVEAEAVVEGPPVGSWAGAAEELERRRAVRRARSKRRRRLVRRQGPER